VFAYIFILSNELAPNGVKPIGPRAVKSVALWVLCSSSFRRLDVTNSDYGAHELVGSHNKFVAGGN